MITTNKIQKFSNSEILIAEISKIAELVATGKKIQLEFDKKRNNLKVIELKSHIVNINIKS